MLHLLCQNKHHGRSRTSDNKGGENERPVTVTQARGERQQNSGEECQCKAADEQQLGTTDSCNTTTADHNGTGDNTKRQAVQQTMSLVCNCLLSQIVLTTSLR
jgi:hypothetical protein